MEEQKLLQAISQMMDEKLAIQKADIIQIMDEKLAAQKADISHEMDRKFAAMNRKMDEKLAAQKAAIGHEMDGKLAVISREMDEKLAAQTQRIEELIKQNNAAIGDMFTKIVEDTRQEIETVKEITKNNTYAIVEMKARQKIAE